MDSFNPDVKNSFNPDDKQYRCCCNSLDVESGAYIIGIVGIVFSAVAFMKSIMIPEWNYVGSAIISFLLYGSIIYAQKKQNPALYLPFLILNGIGIVLMGVYLLVLIVMFAFAPNELDLIDPQMKESEKEKFVMALRVGTGVMIVLLVIAEFLHLWFQSVVFRAYKYTKTIHSSFSPQMQA